MDALRKHFPELTAAEEDWLRRELLRRAAADFERAELWADAADCWADLGEPARAGELYRRGGDVGRAAEALLTAGRYADGLALYRAWEGQLLSGDAVNRVKALLGQAACHLLGAARGRDGGLTAAAGREAYRQARALLNGAAEGGPGTVARCWAALGEYGVRLGRYDLVQEGYEAALARCGDGPGPRDRAVIGRAYLAAARARGDRLLCRTLEERLAEWESAAAEPGPQPGDVFTNSIGMKLAWIPAGKFLMGSPTDEEGRWQDEGPQHEVEITQPFYMGVYEVTQEGYEQVMHATPSWFSAQGSGKDKVAGQDTRRFPVEMVSWNDAVAFCRKLSDLPEEKRAGRVYHLPTEAEWEYACRGGALFSEPFHFGKTLSAAQANIDSKLGRTTTVGSYPANGYGLHDMHGNVWEWCSDWMGNYPEGFVKDPTRPDNGTRRVLRGGSWFGEPRFARSAYRSGVEPGGRNHVVGFRVVVRPGVRTP
jgi:formylglycine-generating enzyme required for sulfatase activity